MTFQSIILSRNNSESDVSISSLISEYIQKSFGLSVENPEILQITETEGKQTIGVEQIGRIIEWNSRKSADTRICIIQDAHKLTMPAQNSLLKILEEPSQNTVIVLVTKYTDNLLETIRSRCIFISEKSLDKVDQYSSFDFQKFLNNDFLSQEEMLTDFIKSREDLGIFLECLQNYIIERKASINNDHLDGKNMLEYVEQWSKSNTANVNIKLILESILAHLGNYE